MSWFWQGLKMLRYGVIYADPPWSFETYSQKGNGRGCAYDTMSLEEISALRVADLAAPDCMLAMWVTDPFLEQAFGVLDSWGFQYKTVGFTWAKTAKHLPEQLDTDKLSRYFPIGTGHHTRANPEMCLFATRGAPKRLNASTRQLILAPRREHSRKPDEAREALERLYRGPRVELFARQKVKGWAAWGNETGKFEVLSDG